MLRDRGGNAQLAWYQVLGLLTQLCLTQALSCRRADQPQGCSSMGAQSLLQWQLACADMDVYWQVAPGDQGTGLRMPGEVRPSQVDRPCHAASWQMRSEPSLAGGPGLLLAANKQPGWLA